MATFENNQRESKRGGKRPGAGRKPGSATTRTREIADRAAAEGLTPLEVMLKAMRHAISRFEETEHVDHLAAAANFAKDAAPYMHPRLSAVEMDADVKVRSLDQELAELNARAE